MTSFALLALVALIFAFNHEQLKNDLYYRFKVFAIVGIANFFVAFYFIYFCSIKQVDNSFMWIGAAVIVLTACLICLTPLIKKNNLHILIAISSLTLTSAVGLFLFDTKIKNFIAISSGYFNHTTFVELGAPTKIIEPIHFNHSSGIYDISVPSTWDRNSLKTGEEYFFINQASEKPVFEFRPKCIYHLGLDFPTLVENLKAQHQSATADTESKCSSSDIGKQCIVQSKYSNNELLERWHWIFIPNFLTNTGVEIDVLFFERDKTIKEDVMKVLSTVNFNRDFDNKNAPGLAHSCLTPSAWF